MTVSVIVLKSYFETFTDIVALSVQFQCKINAPTEKTASGVKFKGCLEQTLSKNCGNFMAV